MAELQTKPTRASVEAFLSGLDDAVRRDECRTLLRLMQRVTGASPKMWGSTIVGFDSYHYTYASGREGDWFLTGFSPRKRDLTLYIMDGFERHSALLTKLGRHRTARSCLYVKRLADLDLKILERLVTSSVRHMRQMYR